VLIFCNISIAYTKYLTAAMY